MAYTKETFLPKSFPSSVQVSHSEIKSISLHRRLSQSRRLYGWPFLVAYLSYALLAMFIYYRSLVIVKRPGLSLSARFLLFLRVNHELYLVPVVIIALAHFLALMGCFWSVHIDTFMTCAEVRQKMSIQNIKQEVAKTDKDSFSSQYLVKVIPKEHRGKAALIPLHHDPQINALYFIFQNLKFIEALKLETDKASSSSSSDLDPLLLEHSSPIIFETTEYPDSLSPKEYLASTGLSTNAFVSSQLTRFGLNQFNIFKPTFVELFKEHAVAPFFVFQVFCVGLWCLDEYWYYSIFTLVMLIIFESTVVQQRLRNIEEFRTMSVQPMSVWALRQRKQDGKDESKNVTWEQISSTELLPGDLCTFAVPAGDEVTVPADLVLLGQVTNKSDGSLDNGSGQCIVNEAMISGESTPLLKEPMTSRVNSLDLPLRLGDDGPDRVHFLFAGTKILQVARVQSDGDDDKAKATANHYKFPELPEDSSGLVCYVARTGFGTLQGSLVRTMMFSAEQVSANNVEAFAFIGVLLIFALVASGYVLLKGMEDKSRNRYRLLLECILIITAVVPPELPMELSLAVNQALQALGQFAIYCMEPFRIPLAGKLDICCFDKTGTLTSENLDVEGIAGVEGTDPENVISDPGKCPKEALLVAATCHSLFRVASERKVDNKSVPGSSVIIAGDPMERATLTFAQGRLLDNDRIQIGSEPANSVSLASTSTAIKILHRFPFSSALKRMSCVVQVGGNSRFITAKGAPETMRHLFSTVPEWYDKVFTQLAHDGARVLALGMKRINVQNINTLTRDQAESALSFVGFLVLRCPLKKDSKAACRLLLDSLHRVVMVTGDNALTALYTARQLDIIDTQAKTLVICIDEDEGEDKGSLSDDPCLRGSLSVRDDLGNDQGLSALQFLSDKDQSYNLCMMGGAVERLSKTNPELLNNLLPKTLVFARASPSQKEMILTGLKALGFYTLMCGDGTNDVGALKQAHVGIALLDGRPEDLVKILKEARTQAIKRQRESLARTQQLIKEAFEGGDNKKRNLVSQVQTLTELMAEQQQQADETPSVKLGDASVAAPFTSKVSSIHAVCTIIRQGRCTLVTTVQMYKILALNSLISAYSLSVLHLSGVRYGDFQVTLTGMLLAGCFMFLTRGQPVKRLHSSRPQTNIFNAYLLCSVAGQFVLHTLIMIYVLAQAHKWTFPLRHAGSAKLKFAPGLVNTAIYLLSLVTQVSTFVVNYQVRKS